MGFSLTVLPGLSSCRKIAKEKAIPYLDKHQDVIPGVANWYASTHSVGRQPTAVLVKTREGRPIKIEGNPDCPVSFGALSPACQASVLSLYDSSRFKGPLKNGNSASFETLDREIIQSLKQSAQNGKRVALVVDRVNSPSQQAIIKNFQQKYKNVDLIIYSPFSRSAEAKSVEATFGSRDVHEYHIDQADFVLGISSDFLSPGVYPVGLTRQYTSRRDVSASKNMLQHLQVEERMSLTGSNADHRLVLSPAEESVFIHNLLFQLQSLSRQNFLQLGRVDFKYDNEINLLAQELLKNRTKSLVMYGGQKIEDAVKVNAINALLGNYGNTLTLAGREFTEYENDKSFIDFIEKASEGLYSHALFHVANPYYLFPDQSQWREAAQKIPVKISLSTAPDETSSMCEYVIPDRHYLEKWNDYEIKRGVYSFAQPVIQSLFDNRAVEETLLIWSEAPQSMYDYMRHFWRQKQTEWRIPGGFENFWAQIIHDGLLKSSRPALGRPSFNLRGSVSTPQLETGLAVTLYQKIGLHKGEFANNPWLQELPDPITKATWDNYLLISPKLAKEQGISSGDIVNLKVSGRQVEAPALVQPGMHPEVVSIALGYGKTVSGKAGKGVGVDASWMATLRDGEILGTNKVESLSKTRKKYKLALTQTHHSLEGRDIVKETTLDEYIKNPKSGNETSFYLYSMWPEHEKTGKQWAMAIDLNKCTGCSACIVSCNAENNVPVVGKEEVFNRREMHWIRIDRYYSGDEANPKVVHQPMMCLHCDNAPCETVCPVLATVQSSDGLNTQIYNRCVGTRYCANNCPYKVRRFNWFNYAREDKLENMVLNPDVTVRSRGVMEKCTMCVQRIQEKRHLAKNEKRELRDGEIKVACQQSCPGDAMVFGDMNDPNSAVAKKLQDPRYYRAIEELGARPRVGYMTKVRQKIPV